MFINSVHHCIILHLMGNRLTGQATRKQLFIQEYRPNSTDNFGQLYHTTSTVTALLLKVIGLFKLPLPGKCQRNRQFLPFSLLVGKCERKSLNNVLSLKMNADAACAVKMSVIMVLKTNLQHVVGFNVFFTL